MWVREAIRCGLRGCERGSEDGYQNPTRYQWDNGDRGGMLLGGFIDAAASPKPLA